MRLNCLTTSDDPRPTRILGEYITITTIECLCLSIDFLCVPVSSNVLGRSLPVKESGITSVHDRRCLSYSFWRERKNLCNITRNICKI